jgi:hypothetical protein
MTPAEAQANKVTKLTNRIRPILAGQDPRVQSAVLADLLSMWLAGHFAGADKKENAKLRYQVLAQHLALMFSLIPIAEAELLERTKKGSS